MNNKTYKKNFLTEVIFRIDFDQVKLGQLKKFAEKIKSRFPISEEKRGEEGFVNLNLATKDFNHSANPLTFWEFHNKTRTKTIKIHPTSLSIEYTKYKNSPELLKDIEFVPTFVKDFKVKTINRLGLRYVNQIKLLNKDFLDWNTYINDSLLGSLDFAKEQEKSISRSMGQMVFKKEDTNINFGYGLWNSNFPNEINEKIFILDFDEYSKFPLDTNEMNLTEEIKSYNKSIEELFESVIKEDLRKILKK